MVKVDQTTLDAAWIKFQVALANKEAVKRYLNKDKEASDRWMNYGKTKEVHHDYH